MTADVIALREHLVAEAERAKRIACDCQRIAADWRAHGGFRHPMTQRNADAFGETARTATDAWLAADARLRALDGLIEAVSPRTQGQASLCPTCVLVRPQGRAA